MIPRVLVAASVRPIMLAILSQGESYGYEIVQRIQDLSDGKIEWSDGTLYPVLHRLEAEGVVVRGGAPPRLVGGESTTG